MVKMLRLSHHVFLVGGENGELMSCEEVSVLTVASKFTGISGSWRDRAPQRSRKGAKLSSMVGM